MTCLVWTVKQGDKFTRALALKTAGVALDLTGKTIRSQIRSTVESVTVAETFNVSYGSPLTLGTATLTLTEAETTALAVGSYVFDVKLDPDTRTLFSGEFVVEPSVTR